MIIQITKEGNNMKTLPNGLKVFNATPHSINFWDESWDKIVVVEPDEIISAEVIEGEYEPSTTDDIFIHMIMQSNCHRDSNNNPQKNCFPKSSKKIF